MLDQACIWGANMNIKENIQSAIGEARYRVAVIGSQSVSLKSLILVALISFALGFYSAVRWDMTGYREYRQKALALQKRKDEENAKLARQLEELRRRFDVENEARERNDREFGDLVDRPGQVHCLVPVEDINPIIAEAGR